MARTTHATHVDHTENLVVLIGEVVGDPLDRALADGSTVVQFDLRTTVVRGDAEFTRTVPLSWRDPTHRDRALVTPSARVLVIGTVERRFFRVGGTTQSRTEVVVGRLVPTRRRQAVGRALDGLAELISGAGGPRDPSAASA